MKTEYLDLFQTVCFIITMQHGTGLISKHPAYINEKKKVSKNPLAAWQMLDFEAQTEVRKWANNWDFPLKKCLHEIEKEA